MSKNLMTEICKKFHVGLGEEFKVDIYMAIGFLESPNLEFGRRSRVMMTIYGKSSWLY